MERQVFTLARCLSQRSSSCFVGCVGGREHYGALKQVHSAPRAALRFDVQSLIITVAVCHRKTGSITTVLYTQCLFLAAVMISKVVFKLHLVLPAALILSYSLIVTDLSTSINSILTLFHSQHDRFHSQHSYLSWLILASDFVLCSQ